MNSTANMPLKEFVSLVFMAEREAKRGGKHLAEGTQRHLRKMVAAVTIALGRQPVVRDLSRETHDLTLQQSPTWQIGKIRLFSDYFLAVWSCAYRRGLVNQHPPTAGERWLDERKELAKLRWTEEQAVIIATKKPEEAASELGISIAAVYYARYNMRLLHTPEKTASVRRSLQPRKMRRKRSPKKSPLSVAAGTLNWLLHKKYFPRNVRIRSQKTKVCYDKALRDFRDMLRHEPTIEDLTDDNIEALQARLRESKLAPKTVNERIGRIVALWNWLAKKRMIEQFPAIIPLPCPQRSPTAWTQEQLAKLFDACRREPGTIDGVPAGKWWEAIHAVIWDSGARIGEVLALRWEWLNWRTGFVNIPAEVRKGGLKDAVYSFHASTLALLREIESPKRDLIFCWPFNEATLYYRYGQILKRAGLPTGRKDKFHKIRRSVASHLQAAGVDASTVLMHSSAEVTRESYLDPTIVNKRKTHEVLFRPDASPAQASVAPQPHSPPNGPAVTLADVDALAFL